MAVKRVIVTYHCVLAIIQATAPIVRKSAAARTRTPARKGLEAILLQAPVERWACESKRLGGAADIPAMCLEGAQDRFFFHGIERGSFRGKSRGHGICRGLAPRRLSRRRE